MLSAAYCDHVFVFSFSFQTELKDLKKRLRSSEDEVKKLESENSKYFSALKEVQAKVSAAVGGASIAADETIAEPAAATTTSTTTTTVNGKTETNSS
jgi:hypothetical protein